MKIVHICLSGVVTDGFSYQDNLLSKYHRKIGADVTFITSRWIYNDRGEIIQTDRTDYMNEDEVYMIRLKNFWMPSFKWKFKYFIGLYETLKKEEPDILFIHGPQFLEMSEIVRYLKENKEVSVYVDNHADFSNSGTNWLSKNLLHKILWRHSAQMIEPYTTKFYGVLPARVDWLIDIYRIPRDKCELLVMGADDEYVQRANNYERLLEIRSKFGIEEKDFVIVTGGKIDSFKLQTLLLMEAVKNINNQNIKLLVFGSVQKDIKTKLESLCDGVKVQYIGWAKGNQSYDYFALANLVVFPGRHSVYWEQVAGMGIPMLCKYWEGTTHIDIGGNVKFLRADSVKEIQNQLIELLENPNLYTEMLEIAQNEGKNKFSYQVIAKKSIGIPI